MAPLNLVLLWAVCAVAHVLGLCSDDGFSAAKTLNAGVEYTFQYQLVENSSKVLIRVRAKTTGFIGFGFSEAGHMMGSDIVTLSVVNGQGIVDDRFSTWAPYDPVSSSVTPSTPKLDGCQSWTLVCSSETDGYSEYIVSRSVDTGDGEDRKLDLVHDMQLIYAWSTSTDTVSYHGSNRGSTNINFSGASTSSFTIPSDTTSSFDILMPNISLTSDRTHYMLYLHEYGGPTAHITAVEPIIQDDEKSLVHHMLLHDCATGQAIIRALNNGADTYDGAGTNGKSIQSPLGVGPCQGMIFGWAKGGSAVAFPSAAGYRLGPDSTQAIILELHIDNALRTSGNLINSGVRVYVSSTLRANDVGTIILGNPGANFPNMPFGQERVHKEGTCTSGCTSGFSGPINMFLSFPHMHSLGKEIWTVLSPGAGNKTIVSYKQFWNFGFQNQIPINITVEPGDSLSTHCVYDTSLSTDDVQFGPSSSQEMCMDFVAYYPKANFGGLKCGSDEGTRTACGSSIGNPANPIPDGTTKIPDVVSIGDVCTVSLTGDASSSSQNLMICLSATILGAVIAFG